MLLYFVSDFQAQNSALHDSPALLLTITMVATKGAIWDFYNLLIAVQIAFNTYAQVAKVQSCANHKQHIKCLSHATYHVPHGTNGQPSYLVWQSLNLIYSSFILSAEPLTDQESNMYVQNFIEIYSVGPKLICECRQSLQMCIVNVWFLHKF